MSNNELTRRAFLGVSGAAMLGGAMPKAEGMIAGPGDSTVHHHDGKQAARRPNLILFMPDELRGDALSCYGNQVTRTPNFDRLARGGTRFANCYVQYPICGASRCSLLTGWPTSVRGHRSQSYFLRPDEPNMFRYLRQAGYDVFWYGKNDALAAECFYESVSEWNYPELPEHRPAGSGGADRSKGPGLSQPTTFIGRGGGDPKNTAEYGRIQHAVRILERPATPAPFCIFLPLSSPHPPYAAPEGFNYMYHPSDITNLRPLGLPKKPSFYEAIRRAYGLDRVSDDVFRQARARYYGSVSYSDWLLGELLEAVQRTNHENDTAILVLSDHGDYAGDYGLVEKWPSDLGDVLTHVPLIARVPGGKDGQVSADPVMLLDVMATCLEIAGTQAQHTHFSRSLMPQIMEGRAARPRSAVYAEGGYNAYEPQCFEGFAVPGELYYPDLHLHIEHPQTVSRVAMVRTHEHKFIMRPEGESELYSYNDDPFELHNRIDDPALAKVQAELTQQLLKWYVNTTGIAPWNKDQRGLPPYYPTPQLAAAPAMDV